MKRLLYILLFVPMMLFGETYYVALDGDDSDPGTFSEPWLTWHKGIEEAEAGDTVYFRGGEWFPTAHANQASDVVYHSPVSVPVYGNNGTSTDWIHFFNYPGETPILNCVNVDTTGKHFNGGISFTKSEYIHIKGLTVRNVQQTSSGEIASGIGADECNHMKFENLTVEYIGGRGYTYWGIAGHGAYPNVPTDSSYYINCDAYQCADTLSGDPGNGADGWKLDNEVGGYLFFEGCRAWGCSDDGFDISGPGITTFDNCWSWSHRFPAALDGNGFKFGANRGDSAYTEQDSAGNTELVMGTEVSGVRKIVKNCIAANCSGIGFYDLNYWPYYPSNSRVYNNISYGNNIGIQIELNADDTDPLNRFYNNIIYETVATDAGGRPYNIDVSQEYYESHNSWDYADDDDVGSLPWWQPTDTVTVTDADFVSVDYTQLAGDRKSDGSLPDITAFRLVEGSDLIDAGIATIPDVGTIPYNGIAPDLGPWEYGESSQTPAPLTGSGSNPMISNGAILYKDE